MEGGRSLQKLSKPKYSVSFSLAVGFLGGTMVKNPPASAGDPGLGRFSGEGNGNPLQYSCLENSEEPGGLQSMGSQRSRHH